MFKFTSDKLRKLQKGLKFPKFVINCCFSSMNCLEDDTNCQILGNTECLYLSFDYIYKMRILGIMSGSSLDGIDLVSVVFDSSEKLSWKLEASGSEELPVLLKNSLKSIVDQTAFEIAETESLYTKFISVCINRFMKKLSGRPDCASVHGHTILHLPNIQTSWQLLNGGMCAALTGIDILCDFRNTDMSFGGQGTPMAVIADRDLFAGYDYYINLGGIANISFENNDQWLAYDIAPCNQVSNHFASKKGLDYDLDGQLAKSGNLNKSLLKTLLNDSYIKSDPPKSLDNSWIKNHWLPIISAFDLSPEDVLQTHNTFIIKEIKNQIVKSSGKILVTGGGAKNTYFMELMRNELGSNFELSTISNDIIDFKEAILMSYLAYLRINNKSNFIGKATGASYDSVGGAWYSSPVNKY